MKKAVGLILLMLMLVCFGCRQPENKPAKEQPLNEKQIVGTFAAANIRLHRIQEKTEDRFIINSRQPTVYQIKNWPDSYLYLYVFDTMYERKKLAGWNSIYDDKFVFDDFAIFTAKNVLILYSGRQNSLADYRDSKIIGEIVWDKLNQAKTINYKGEGKYWRGTYQIKYFQHFMEEKGRLSIDSCQRYNGKISFKGDPADVGSFSYTCQRPGSRGSSGGSDSNYSRGKDNMVSIGGGGSNDAFSMEGDVVLTINWAGKSEIIQLKEQ